MILYMDAAIGAAGNGGKIMATFNGKQLKAGLTVDTWVDFRSGETHYTVCDAIGVVFSTIFPSRLERFYAEAA